MLALVRGRVGNKALERDNAKQEMEFAEPGWCRGMTDGESHRQEEGTAEPYNEDTGFESNAYKDLDSGMDLKVCMEREERKGGIYELCS